MPSVQTVLDERPRILVADDESVICDILRDCLQFEGFYVLAVGSGEAAFEVLGREPFDIVLTDLKMPGMDGLELIRRVKDLESDVLSVIMTGFGTVETAIEAMKEGAFDYILKPFKPEEVVRVLRRGIEKLQLQRENLALKETVGFYELSEALSSAMPLDEQLEMIVELVRDNFSADGVSIVVQDAAAAKEPNCHADYRTRAFAGADNVHLESARIIQRFLQNEAVLAHGDDVVSWLAGSRSADHIVHSFMSAPLRMRGAPFGLISAYSVRSGHKFTEGQRKGLCVFGGRAASAIETARMYGNLKETFTQTIEGFARALETKDAYTAGHSDRVATYSRLIANVMGLPEIEVDRIEHGGLMHDVGKIGIRSSELNKPQKLTPSEYMMFQSHPVLGRRIIEPISFLVYLIPCVYYHHEAFDGSGYPEGLDGQEIPLEARILAVADSYDAMTSNRPYRKALPHDIAVAEFKRCAGKQFDPVVVQAFLGVVDDFRRERTEQGLAVPD